MFSIIKSYSVLIIAAFLACTDASPEAENWVRNVYKLHRSHEGIFATDSIAESVYAPLLLKFMRKDLEISEGEAGYLNWDPLCDCQDDAGMQVEKVEIRDGSDKNCHAKIRLRISESMVVVGMDLIREGHTWRIEDIVTERLPSLKEYLRSNLGD